MILYGKQSGFQKKLLYFSDTRLRGGAEHYLIELACSLDQNRFIPAVVLAGADAIKGVSQQLIERGIPVDTLETSNEFPMKSFFRSLGYFIKKGPDLIHFNIAWPPFCRYPILASLLLGKKVILTEHLVPHNYKLSPYEQFYKKLTYSGIFKAISVSFENRANLVRIFKIPESKIAVIHNGIDCSRFEYSHATGKISAPFATGDNKVVVTTIARLANHKGHCFLIRAAKQLKHLPGLVFVIVGNGPLETKLIQDVQNAGMKNRFLFLGFRSDIPEILAQTDIFVLPSLFEGLPLTVLEAMAGGIPVIGTRISGIPEAVIDGKTGILVPPGNPESLAEAIATLAKDPQKRRQMGEEGKRRVREHFSHQRMVREVENLYESAFTQ